MKKRKVSISQVLNIISLVAVMLLGFQIYLTCPSQDDSLNRTERLKVAQRNEFTKSNAELRGLVGVGTLNKHGTGSNNGNKKKRSKFSTRLAFNAAVKQHLSAQRTTNKLNQTNSTTLFDNDTNNNNENETKMKMEPNKKKISIFMHTFFQTNQTAKALDIVFDQLHRMHLQPLLDHSTVYYTTIGELQKWARSKCQNSGKRKCISIASKKKGDESITLQQLHDYCTIHKDERVIYIHNKGSYTQSHGNRILRNVLMKAITSTDCLEMPPSCNTCSSQFSGSPVHYPGNMWVADCDYVSNLIPPQDFTLLKQKVIHHVKNYTKPIENDYFETRLEDGTWFKFHNSTNWMIDRESWLGLNRYAMEHWIGSHPDIQPCDVFSRIDGYPNIGYNVLQTKLQPDNMQPKLRLAPGVGFREYWTNKYKIHPWFRKAGRLYEYRFLYSKEPDYYSWFYSFWENIPELI